jgi:hypothetical protein
MNGIYVSIGFVAVAFLGLLVYMVSLILTVGEKRWKRELETASHFSFSLSNIRIGPKNGSDGVPLSSSIVLFYNIYCVRFLFENKNYIARFKTDSMLKGEVKRLMKRKFRKNLKGISTIIATIIIVAISIVMAIAVAYWAMGIGGSFTRFEKLTFTSAWAETNSTGYFIHMVLNNTGTAAATIDPGAILYNGKPGSAYGTTGAPTAWLNGKNSSVVTLNPGAGLGRALIELPSGTSSWKSGMTVEVAIQTAAGNSYPKTVSVP